MRGWSGGCNCLAQKSVCGHCGAKFSWKGMLCNAISQKKHETFESSSICMRPNPYGLTALNTRLIYVLFFDREDSRVCSTVASFDPERESWGSGLSSVMLGRSLPANLEPSFDPSEASMFLVCRRRMHACHFEALLGPERDHLHTHSHVILSRHCCVRFVNQYACLVCLVWLTRQH